MGAGALSMAKSEAAEAWSAGGGGGAAGGTYANAKIVGLENPFFFVPRDASHARVETGALVLMSVSTSPRHRRTR